MSIGILFLGMHQISTGILQGLGRTAIPVINMIIACIVKIVMSWYLTAVPELGIRGGRWRRWQILPWQRLSIWALFTS